MKSDPVIFNICYVYCVNVCEDFPNMNFYWWNNRLQL